MKNLSLLFLMLTGLSVEMLSSAEHPRRGGKKYTPIDKQPTAGGEAEVTTHSAKTKESNPAVVQQPTTGEKGQAEVRDQKKDLIVESYEEWNKKQKVFGIPVAEALAKRKKNIEVINTAIKNRLDKIPYVRPVDETDVLKKTFNPVVQALNLCQIGLVGLSRAKEKSEKKEFCTAIQEPEPTKNPKLSLNVKTLPLSEIVPFMEKKQDPYATSTESFRTVVDCGQSIIEGSRISDIEHTATNFAATPTEKNAILEAKRIAEFSLLLAQLEGYARTRDLETNSQTRLDELEKKASSLEIRLLHPTSEPVRIETERALLSITREKAGVMGQLEGARKDRVRKNNAIVVARREAGSYKALLGAFGAKTADYVSNPQETPLMIDELFSNVLPQLSKEEKRKRALAFLDILTGKIKTTKPAKKTWTGQESIKTVNHPDFSCIIPGKDLSRKDGTEREILMVNLEQQTSTKKESSLAALVKLYEKRADFTPDDVTAYKGIPPLDELHKRRDARSHWAATGSDPRTSTWEKIQPIEMTTLFLTRTDLGGAKS